MLATLSLALSASAVSLTEYRTRVLDPAMHTFRYFPLTEADGPTVADASVNAANGVYSSGTPEIADGPFFNVPLGGRAPLFSGDGRIASAPISTFADAINGPDGATFVAWFRTQTSNPGTLLGLYEDEGSNFTNGFELSVGKDEYFPFGHAQKIVFSVSNDFGAFRSASAAIGNFGDGDWHMLACSYRLGAIAIFFDSVLQPSHYAASSLREPLHPFAVPMRIGAAVDAEGGFGITPIHGSVAHVSLHAKALTAEQVLALWQAGNGYDGLAVYGVEAFRPWFDAAAVQRVDAMVMGDSNLVLGTDGGKYGHQYGMAQGMRRVLPIYASAVLPGIGTGSWGAPTNAITPFASNVAFSVLPPPPHITAAVPPATAGFPTAAAYANPGRSIAGDSNWAGPIEWQSPDLMIDFTARLQFHFAFATFADNAGVFHPRVRQFDSPYTPLSGKTITTGPFADAIAEDSLEIPAGPRACGRFYTIQVTDHATLLSAQGPFALLYSRFVLPDVNTGAAMTPAWSVGGVGARVAADAFWNKATLSQIGAYLRQVVRHQPAGAERLLVQIIEGQNDVGDWNGAISVTGATTNIYSNTLRGQKLNTLAIMSRVRAAWIAQGFDPDRLHFLLGPYHPSDHSDALARTIPYVYLRGWKELAIEHPEFHVTVMDGYGFTSPAELAVNAWYQSPIDQAHLNKAGYLNFGIKTWQALRDAVGAVAVGACCSFGGTCSTVSGDQCISFGGIYQGGGSACTPNPCRQTLSACCLVNGSCLVNSPDVCVATSGAPQGNCAACEFNLCPEPPGACCAVDGSCRSLPPSNCRLLGATALGQGIVCGPNPCPQPVFGACCRHTVCTTGPGADCTGAGARFAGNTTTCNPPGQYTTPCCAADFNQSGHLSIQDLLEFLSAWFARNPSADWDQSGGDPSIQDLFSFLAGWFAGCSSGNAARR